MIKLIACDIDGTLLKGGDKAIDNAVFQEIIRLQGLGILFCPASGRQYSSLRKLFSPVADSLYFHPWRTASISIGTVISSKRKSAQRDDCYKNHGIS